MSAYLNVSVRIRKRHSFLQVDAAQCQDTQLCNGSMGQISAPLSLGQMSLCSEQPAQLYIAALVLVISFNLATFDIEKIKRCPLPLWGV